MKIAERVDNMVTKVMCVGNSTEVRHKAAALGHGWLEAMQSLAINGAKFPSFECHIRASNALSRACLDSHLGVDGKPKFVVYRDAYLRDVTPTEESTSEHATPTLEGANKKIVVEMIIALACKELALVALAVFELSTPSETSNRIYTRGPYVTAIRESSNDNTALEDAQ